MIRTVILLGETKPTYAPGGAPSAVSTPRKKTKTNNFHKIQKQTKTKTETKTKKEK